MTSLAAIVVADCYRTVAITMAHLASQTARDELEVIVVAPSRVALAPDEQELSLFGRAEVVEVGQIDSLPSARARGIRAARSPVVVLTESHSYPEADWAAALIEAHRGGAAAVGPVLANANPGTLSWAALLIAYGAWVEGAPGGPAADLPGHNSSYKRDVLIDYGASLVYFLEMESALHADLRRRGLGLYLEPAARTRHVNVSRPRSFMRVRYHSGRLFGAARAREWHFGRRLVFAAGSPLIPIVRLCRFSRDLRRPGSPSGLIPRVLPALTLGLVLSSIGEMVGYLLGPGGSSEAREDIELHREVHVNP